MGDHRSRDALAKSRHSASPKGLITDSLRASNDIVLIVDDAGVVRDVAIDDRDLAKVIGSAWLDQPLIETVTVESRSKVKRMLEAAGGDMIRQEINHTLGEDDLPVRYAAVRLAPDGPVAVLGRDLRDIARLQQLLVDTNLAIERDYALHRATEIQFRVLFQHAADAVVIADAASRRVVDINPVAEDLLRRTARHVIGVDFAKLFAEAGARDVQDGFAAARAMGQAAWPSLVLRQTEARVGVAGWLIRSSAQPQLLLKLSPVSTAASPRPAGFGSRWEALRKLPEALVATDDALSITDANESFLDLVGAATVERVRGNPLSRYLGRNDLHIVTTWIDEGAGLRGLPVSVRDQHGISRSVEMSGALDRSEGVRFHCFMFRSAGGGAGSAAGKPALKAADEMTGLVGRMPLREIVRETADIIEGLCIEAALELTNDNRASAAEVLGLSRQSLYAKLRRYGLGNLPGGDPEG